MGGAAEFLVRAGTTGVLVHAVLTARELGLPVTVLGRCTNVLVWVMLAWRASSSLRATTARPCTGSPCLRRLASGTAAARAADVAGQGLAGLTFAANIPGSVPRAWVGNAGAYGESVSDALLDVHLLEEGKEHVVQPDRVRSGYRTSMLKSRPDIVVLSVWFQLHHGHRDELLRRIAEDASLRRSKHPLEYASCGSYFKNPSLELPAARLIEEAGLKGLRGPLRAREREARELPGRRGRARPRPTSPRSPRRSCAGSRRPAATSSASRCAGSASPEAGPHRAILLANDVTSNPPTGTGVSHPGGRQ